MPSAVRVDALATPLPAAPPEPRADPAARMLLQRAQGAIQKWPEIFHGFRARLTVTGNGQECSGWALVGPRGDVEVDLVDLALTDWARDTLHGLVAERVPRFFKDGDGRFPISFDPDASPDAGRAIVVHRGGHGAMDIRYRIDERARVRQRAALETDGLHVHTYETFARATPGRILPLQRSAVVSADGRVLRRELHEDRHVRVGHAWLPAERRVLISALDAALSRRLRLHDHALV